MLPAAASSSRDLPTAARRSPTWRTWLRTLRRVAAAVALAAVAIGAWPLWLHLTGNFHAVVPGEVYRAAQPEGEDLRRWAAEHGLRSVLNLRGTHDDSDWYREESATAHELGLVLADFPLSARQNPGTETMAQLVDLMRRLPKPLLIHCQGGADRTGLAAALYLASIAGVGEDVAGKQISFAFGHVGVPRLSSAWAMDEAWKTAKDTMDFPES